MKKLIFTLLLGSLAISTTASAEIVPTVRRESSPVRIAEVQDALNECAPNTSLTVDGRWGSRTESAVRRFQNKEGLQPVGYVGPLTATALNDCYYGGSQDNNDDDTPNNGVPGNTGTPTNGTVPLCPNGATIASNCTQYPTNVPALCPNGATIASNCTQTPNNTGGTNFPGGFQGVEGTLTSITKLGAYNSTRIYENEQDVQVLGIQTIARDADQKIEGVVVSMYNSNTSTNRRPSRYAREISIWLNGVEIGRKSTQNYSDESNDVYVYRFTGMNGIIQKNQTGQIIVALTGASTIDSQDAANESWTISMGSSTTAANDGYFISSASPNGHYRDYGNDSTGSTFTSTIDFEKAGGASSAQKFRITIAPNNPVTQVVQVSNTSPTNDQLLLSFDAKAENAPMLVQRMPVKLTATGNGVGVNPDVSAIVRVVKLYMNGNQIDTQTIPTGSGSVTVTFGQYSRLQKFIGSNTTARFEVRADLEDIESGTGNTGTEFDNGDMIRAEIGSTELNSSLIELDNFFQDTVANKTGNVFGENQMLRSYGAQVTMGTAQSTYSSNSYGEIVTRTISIPVKVRAFDEALFLAPNVENAVTPTGTAAFGFIVEDENGNPKTVINSATLSAYNVPVQNGVYRVDPGTEREFTITITLTGNPTVGNVPGDDQKQYRVQLTTINTYTDSALTGQTLQTLVPETAFQTTYFTLNLE